MEAEESAPSCPQLVCSTRLRFQKDVSRVSVNSGSNLAALCTKKLSIIGLSAPFALARELALANKAAPQMAQFSPHSHQPSQLAAYAGQAVYLFNLNDARTPLQATLAHQRNVRWLAWSLFDSNVIATCAADNSIHLWDIRDLKAPKPSSSLKVFTSGISSVKWNKVNQHVLASSHDIQVEIWDLRRTSSSPVTFITAHPTKISNIDWNSANENELITSSADGTVKFWDVKKSRICQGTIATGSPVVKACYGPSGQSVLVLNAAVHMHVYSVSSFASGPVLELAGNKESLCPDFGSCERVGATNKEVVSWSRDAHLCVWDLPDLKSPPGLSSLPSSGAMDAGSFNSGHNSIVAAHSAPSFASLMPSSPGPRHSSGGVARDAPGTPGTPGVKTVQSLRDELDDIEHAPVDGLSTESQIAALSRQVIARTVDYSGRGVALKISFPSLYPHNASPSFEFLSDSQLGTESILALLASMQSLCRRLTAQSHFCLRPVLVLLRKSVMSEDLLQAQRSKRSSSTTDKLSSSASDASSLNALPSVAYEVPCPRLSGACFAPNGRLVCFSNLGINFSVRTFAKLREALAGGTLAEGEDATSATNLIQPVVTHYNLLHIAPLSLDLAALYVLTGQSVRALCLHNAAVSKDFGAVSRAWHTLAAVMQACEAGAIPVTHALARGLVHQILDHFEQTCDLQTVAVMSRVLLSSARRANAPPPSSVVSSALERATKSLRSKTLVSASGGVTIEQLQPQQQEQQQLQSQEQQQSQQVQQVQQQEQQQQQEIAQQQQQQEKQQQQQQQEKQDKQHYEKSQQDKQHHVQDKVWTKRLFQKSKARQRASSEAEQPPQMLFAPASISSYLVSSPPAPPVVQGTPVVIANYTASLPSVSSVVVMMEQERCVIHPARIARYLSLQSIYADQLLSFGLCTQRAQMLKSPLRNTPPSQQKALSFEGSCTVCGRNVVNSRHCPACKVFLFPCSVCHLPVKGLYSLCVSCGHGCHTSCVQQWLATAAVVCPSQGCNCKCLTK